MRGSLLSTGAGWVRPPAPSTAVTPPLVHSVHRPEGAAAGPAGVQRPAMAGVGPRGPQAEGDGVKGEGLLGCGQGGRRAGPLSKLGVPLFGAQQSCLHGPCRRSREQRKWTDSPCPSLSPGAGGGGVDSPRPVPHDLLRQPWEVSGCGRVSTTSAGRSGAPGPLERAGRARCAGERVRLLPSSWAGPGVRVCTRVHAYTCARVVCVHDRARVDGAEAWWAHPPCSPQRRGGFSKWVLCALRRPWARSCPRSPRTELPEGLTDRLA